jgi:hypothetical protein
MGSRSCVPTSAPRGGPSTPRARTSPRPTGSRSRAPTAAPRGGRHSPRCEHVSSSHGQPFSRAHFSTSRWPPLAALAHVSSSHGQPFSRAHFSTSRWPPSPRSARLLVPRAAVLARPLQHLEVAALAAYAHVSSSHGQPFSRAHFSTSRWPPRRDAHVPSSHGQPFSRAHFSVSRWPPPPRRARLLVPRAAVLARPFQHREVARRRRARARPPRSHGQSFARAHFRISR